MPLLTMTNNLYLVSADVYDKCVNACCFVRISAIAVFIARLRERPQQIQQLTNLRLSDVLRIANSGF